MILRMILTLLMLFPTIANAMGNEVFQEMMQKINSRDFGAIENFLEKNRNAYGQDPEYYVILLNYSFAKGAQKQTVIAKGEPGKGDLSLRDSTTGEIVGFIGGRSLSDDKLIVRSIQETKDALKHFNDRLGIHFGITHIAFETKHWQILREQLLEILKVSKSINNKWRWGSVNSMQGDPKNFMLDNVQSKINGLFHIDSEETDQVAEAVSSAMIREYPRVIYGYSDLGVLYLAQKKYDLAEKYLNQAFAIDPKDEIVRSNLKLLREKRK
jgi:tetratricopeptide (TPR) repeat protein